MSIWGLIQRLLGRSDIYTGNDLYMERWRIVDLVSWGVRLHHILRSDVDPELHDHEWDYCSVVLWGGYYEQREDGKLTWYGPGSVVRRSAETRHRLELKVHAKGTVSMQTGTITWHSQRMVPAWTLVFRGRRRRKWGFWLKSGIFVPWQEFVAARQHRSNIEARPFAAESSL
jgi:hypothetical protein